MDRKLTVKRYEGLDILKCFCAFLVVCIHYPPAVRGSSYLVALTRIAVPIFFMITGFFYADAAERKKTGKQLKKIFRLVILSNLLYFAWDILFRLMQGQDVRAFFAAAFSKESAVRFLLLNESPFVWHLWYLSAIFYVLVLVGAMRKAGAVKLLYLLTPLFLVLTLVLGRYSRIVFHREFLVSISRNFLFAGVPYFCMGLAIRKADLAKRLAVHRGAVLVGAVLFSGTTWLEHWLLETSGLRSLGDYYISTAGLAAAVFLLFLTDRPGGNCGRLRGMLAHIGREYSTGIYVVQIIVGTLLAMVLEGSGIFAAYKMAAPIVVFSVSALCTAAYRKAAALFEK